MYECTETGSVRRYGAPFPFKVTRRELEEFFGPLDWHPPLPGDLLEQSEDVAECVDVEASDLAGADAPSALAAEQAA